MNIKPRKVQPMNMNIELHRPDEPMNPEEHSSSCILFFMRCPEMGEMKKRLSTHLDDEFILRLHENFIRDHLATLEELEEKETDLWICTSHEMSVEECTVWLGRDRTGVVVPQEGSDIGERMKNCFLRAFENGYRRAILMGSDIPDLPGGIILQALHSLETHDSVIGPSTDGGYYLIGFTRKTFIPRIFENIPWSTEKTLGKTLEVLEEHGLNKHLLPEWNDVDTFHDLIELVKRNRHTPFRDSGTMLCLRDNPIVHDALESGRNLCPGETP